MPDAVSTNPPNAVQLPTFVDVDRIPLKTEARGCQNRQNMRILAIVMIAFSSLGLLLAGTAITAGALSITVGALSASTLLGAGIAVAAALIAIIALGIFLLKSPYWQDPLYMYEQSQRALAMPFDDIVKNFPWEHIKSQHLISYNALHRKFFNAIKDLDYNSVITKYGSLIREHSFIKWADLKHLLTTEAQNMNSEQFKKTYGNQPCLDGVVEANDLWYSTMVKNGIKNLTYNEIASRFSAERATGVLEDQYIAEILPFDEIVIGFSWEQIKRHHIISYEAFKKKFFDRIASMEYSTVIAKYGQIIREHQFIHWSDLKAKLKSESETMVAATFKSVYNDQPCADGVVDTNDAWYCNMMKEGIKELPYSRIASEYGTDRQKGIIKNEDIAEVLKAQFTARKESFNAFYIFQGKHMAWKIITDNIIPSEFFTPHMMSEISQEKLTIQQILKRYGWDLFTHNVLSGEKFRNVFLDEVRELSFSKIIESYGWALLTHKMAMPSDLNPYATKECASLNSFGQVLQQFGTLPFEHGVLSYADEAVRSIVLHMCNEMPFCTMIDTHGTVLQKHKLLPPHRTIPTLITKKVEAESRLSLEHSNANQAYDQKKTTAERNRDSLIQLACQSWEGATRAVEDENARYHQAHTEMNAQISQAESRMSDQEQRLLNENRQYDLSLTEFEQKIQRAKDKQTGTPHEHEKRMYQIEISTLSASKGALISRHPTQVAMLQNEIDNSKSSISSMRTMLNTLSSNHLEQQYKLQNQAAQLKQSYEQIQTNQTRVCIETIALAETERNACYRMAADLCTQTKALIDTEFRSLDLQHAIDPSNEA